MTGSDIIGELLLGYARLVAEVPAARIKAGKLPANTPLNALLVKTTSSVERQRLKRGHTVRTVDRVSVTVRAGSYDEQVRIIELVTDACADRTGQFAGSPSVSVLTAGRGPDLAGPGDSFEQVQDFKVSFDKRFQEENSNVRYPDHEEGEGPSRVQRCRYRETVLLRQGTGVRGRRVRELSRGRPGRGGGRHDRRRPDRWRCRQARPASPPDPDRPPAGG